MFQFSLSQEHYLLKYYVTSVCVLCIVSDNVVLRCTVEVCRVVSYVPESRPKIEDPGVDSFPVEGHFPPNN